MKSILAVPVAFVALALIGCEPKSAEPKQSTPVPSASPEPTPSAAPSASPAESPSSSPAANSSESSSGYLQFASQAANKFVESYDAFIADFKTAYEAMKDRDMTKYEAILLRAHELETEGEKLESGLSSDEQKKFADYLNRRADELAAISSAK
jgi:hypothetical protein